MRHLKTILFPATAAAFVIVSGCASRSSVQNAGPALGSVGFHTQDISFANLPSIEVNFRADPYVKVAEQLQDMGQQAAVQQLLDLAVRATPGVSEFNYEENAAILCRMLFTNKLNTAS